MGWNGMGCDGMGWDGMGWDGTRQNGMVRDRNGQEWIVKGKNRKDEMKADRMRWERKG